MNEQIKKIIESLDEEYRETIEDEIREMSIYDKLTIVNKEDGIIITNITDMDKKIFRYLKDNIEDIIIGIAHIKKTSDDLLNELGSILEVNSIEHILQLLNRIMTKSILYISDSEISFIKVIEEINIIRNISDYNDFKMNIAIEEDIFDLIG